MDWDIKNKERSIEDKENVFVLFDEKVYELF